MLINVQYIVCILQMEVYRPWLNCNDFYNLHIDVNIRRINVRQVEMSKQVVEQYERLVQDYE